MNETLQQLMRDATRLTRAGQLSDATAAIQRGLRGDAPIPAAPSDGSSTFDPANDAKRGAITLDATATTPGGNVFEVKRDDADAAKADFAATDVAHDEDLQKPSDDALDEAFVDDNANTNAGSGDFTSGNHRHASKTLCYKLYTPPVYAGQPLPLVVMLHGCTQNPDDFAAGTGMNVAARAQGFFVLYPEQSQAANSSRCWNWFQPNDQHRGQGEPAFIASMTDTVMKQHNIDPRRVYIAGLSAGGAMATIVAEAYPEIFAAVGVHSGLPRGAASNVMEALTVMKSGQVNRDAPVASTQSHAHVRTIVFHGDRDHTVHSRNGEQVIAAVFGGAEYGGKSACDTHIEHGVSSCGRHYTRSIHHDASGEAVAEHWLVHGAGHAWSGGDAAGTHTDASGPDATREMLRFFFEQPNRSMH